MFAIHVKAENDRNGNPRRLFLVCGEHGPIVAVDEGYSGEGAIREAGYFAPVVADIHVKPAEYKLLRKKYPEATAKQKAKESREYHASRVKLHRQDPRYY